MATVILIFLDHTTSSVVAMSPELSRIIFALTDSENLQSGWSVAKPRFEPGTCGILSRGYLLSRIFLIIYFILIKCMF
jgi:hypothetical protein